MEIIPLGNDKFQVLHEGKMNVLTLDEVMFLLSRPVSVKEKTQQEELEEFWASEPWYMTR